MSYSWNTRTELLLGADRMEYLAKAHVLVVGLGSVGAYAAEQICRAGIGHMTIVDADTVNESNLNRQLPALHSTLGKPKAEVMASRLTDINPKLKLTVINEFLRDERTEEVLSAKFDNVIKTVQSVSRQNFHLAPSVSMLLTDKKNLDKNLEALKQLDIRNLIMAALQSDIQGQICNMNLPIYRYR